MFINKKATKVSQIACNITQYHINMKQVKILSTIKSVQCSCVVCVYILNYHLYACHFFNTSIDVYSCGSKVY